MANRELGGNIDLSQFILEGRHVEDKDVSRASYNQVWLRSLCNQSYYLGKFNLIYKRDEAYYTTQKEYPYHHSTVLLEHCKVAKFICWNTFLAMVYNNSDKSKVIISHCVIILTLSPLLIFGLFYDPIRIHS